MDFAKEIADFFEREGLFATAGVVAISGGPDSVALAHVLTELARQGKFRSLSLSHLNHQLRGEESTRDAAFVQSLAETWSRSAPVGWQIRGLDVRACAEEAGENLEATARLERYRWLTQVARDEGATWVATGHSADDQAETILFRILRGTGLRGLIGIMPRRNLVAGVDLVRPMLHLRRQEVLAYLQSQELSYCEDSTNRDMHHTRNRLRHDLIPKLSSEYNPNVVGVLCNLSQQARETQEGMEAAAREMLVQVELPRAGEMVILREDIIATRSRHVLREMMRLIWQREGWPMARMGFQDWQRLATGAPGDFPGRIRVRKRKGVIQIYKAGERGVSTP